jgi:arylsulfatase
MMRRAFLLVPAQELVTDWLKSLQEFLPRQKPASFNLDEVMQKLAPKD